MATKGISFLYEFDLGNRHIDEPAKNILSFTSQAEGDFDISNITTESTRHRWRSASVLTAQEIVIKAERKSKLDTFAILGHNFSQNAIITLQANISNNFLAPPITQQLVWAEDNIVFANELPGEFEYYKISVLDPSNPCGYIEIGRIIGGQAVIMQNNEDITDSVSVGYTDMSEKMKTQGFFRQGNENVLVRDLSVRFQKLYTTIGMNENYKALRAMFKYVKTTRPFLTILDRSDPEWLNMWGQLNSIPSDSFGVNNYVSFGLKITEMF